MAGISKKCDDSGVENRTPLSGFAGLRVLSLESRRAAEMAKLIANYGGVATVAPSMQEIPLESNTEAQDFARTLAADGFDMVIFLTGVGARALSRVAETVYPRDQFVAALRRVTLVARGPKPVAALKEMGVPVTLAVPEPNTWRELLQALDQKADSLPLNGRRVAVQEYGASNAELLAGLAQRGAQVTRVPVYEWALPDDVGPLRAAVSAIAHGEIDVALFTTSVQVIHLLKIAAEMKLEEAVRSAFARILVGSIGPVTSEELRAHGIPPDFEPSHPKMGFLVNEAAQQSAELLRQKRDRPLKPAV
jgi:uroporphyrinogen-III synthase